MLLSESQLAELETLAIRAAERAGTMIQEEAEKEHEVLRKEGGSNLASQVVTEVDFESQRLILDTLQESMTEFDLGLLTEESPDDQSRHRCDYFWCIDPLDGTLPFIEGMPGYAVSIALVSRAGAALIGVVFDPTTRTLYHAVQGKGAYRDGELWNPTVDHENTPLTLVMDRSFAQQPNYPDILARVESIALKAGLNGVHIINHGGAAMNACWVIENAPAVYFKFPKPENGGGSLWDYAATSCLFTEIEASATDIHGAPLDLNRSESTFMNHDGIVYASHPSLAQAVLRLYPPSE